MSEKRIFINLVDSGASAKSYDKLLNIPKDNFKSYLKLLPRYRLLVNSADEIAAVKARRGTSVEIIRIRQKLNEDWEKLDG